MTVHWVVNMLFDVSQESPNNYRITTERKKLRLRTINMPLQRNDIGHWIDAWVRENDSKPGAGISIGESDAFGVDGRGLDNEGRN